MIARLRCHRWLATLLLAFSPGFAGQVVQLLHPCPTSSVRLAGAHAAMPGMTHDAGAPAHGPAHHHGTCDCIGGCATPAITTPPQPFVATVAVEAPRRASWRIIEATHYRPASVDRLPEKTAPPLA